MRAYFLRHEVVKFLKQDFDNLLDFLSKKGVLSTEELLEKFDKAEKAYNKSARRRMYPKERIKNHYDTLELALDICCVLKADDTSVITSELKNDAFINKIIDFRKEQEINRNNEIDKNGKGFKSFLYQRLDDDGRDL